MIVKFCQKSIARQLKIIYKKSKVRIQKQQIEITNCQKCKINATLHYWDPLSSQNL